MKIVGLLAFRDEEPYLPYLLASLAPLVDAVIAMDDRSTDAGPDLVRDAGGTVVAAPREATFGGRRGALLELGRRAGGTHFVIVDADETFSEPFARAGRRSIENLQPGEALALPFRTLWKGEERYRVGREYDLPLTCIFGDDGTGRYDDVVLHEPRVPLAIGRGPRIVPPSEGEMFHLQFAAWRRSQIKQAWYRCRELVAGASPLRINARYLTTVDGRLVRTRPVDPEAMAHLPSLSPLINLPPSWHLAELMAWMDRFGPAHFEPLQIWHVPELRDAFLVAEGRAPRSVHLAPHLARLVGDAYGSSRARLRHRHA